MKTLFYVENKWIAQSTKLFTDVLYIFLGHDGCFWKISLRIFWNHMKNFQVKHGQCDGIIFPKTFSFKSFRQLLDLCYAGSRILYYWKVLESFDTFLGVISQCAPFLYPLEKVFLSPSVGQEENIPGHSIERRAYYFVLKIARVFPIPTRRVGVGWWTLL